MLTPFGSSGPLIRAGDRQGWLRFIGAHMAGGGGGFRLTAEGKLPGAATVPLRGPTSSVAPSLSTAWCPRPCHRSCSGKWEAHTGCLSDQKTLPMGCSVRRKEAFHPDSWARAGHMGLQHGSQTACGCGLGRWRLVAAPPPMSPPRGGLAAGTSPGSGAPDAAGLRRHLFAGRHRGRQRPECTPPHPHVASQPGSGSWVVPGWMGSKPRTLPQQCTAWFLETSPQRP